MSLGSTLAACSPSGWGEVPVSSLVPGARMLTGGAFDAPTIRVVKLAEPPTSTGLRRIVCECGAVFRLAADQLVWGVLPDDDEPEDLRRLAVIR